MAKHLKLQGWENMAVLPSLGPDAARTTPDGAVHVLVTCVVPWASVCTDL